MMNRFLTEVWMTTMEEQLPNNTTIKDHATLDVSITEDRTTTNMTAGGSNKDKPTDNVLHDEEKYGNKQYHANNSANESNKATPMNTIIIAITAQRVLRESAQSERVHSKRTNPQDKQQTTHRERYSRRVHKPGGSNNIKNIVAGPEEQRYTQTIVVA